MTTHFKEIVPGTRVIDRRSLMILAGLQCREQRFIHPDAGFCVRMKGEEGHDSYQVTVEVVDLDGRVIQGMAVSAFIEWAPCCCRRRAEIESQTDACGMTMFPAPSRQAAEHLTVKVGGLPRYYDLEEWAALQRVQYD